MVWSEAPPARPLSLGFASMSPHVLLRPKVLMDFGQNKGGAFEDSRTLIEPENIKLL
jgi:hypothetical protein